MYYDSLETWLTHAPDDEIVAALHVRFSAEELEEFVEELDRLLAAHPEQ